MSFFISGQDIRKNQSTSDQGPLLAKSYSHRVRQMHVSLCELRQSGMLSSEGIPVGNDECTIRWVMRNIIVPCGRPQISQDQLLLKVTISLSLSLFAYDKSRSTALTTSPCTLALSEIREKFEEIDSLKAPAVNLLRHTNSCHFTTSAWNDEYLPQNFKKFSFT